MGFPVANSSAFWSPDNQCALNPSYHTKNELILYISIHHLSLPGRENLPKPIFHSDFSWYLEYKATLQNTALRLS